ncbi:MAG TPA: 3-keto-5-aminohexanoate cleavage protein [Candidatus Lokiarchaeia archaeon]|nr:3-keto-5-aminohexanoate cleavage protein [Candidatus Lokiarchaeia archaeon]
MLENKVIITAALTGAVTRKEQNPATPYSPEEFGDVAAKCLAEGAAIVHIHVRNPETGAPTPNLEMIGATIKEIKAQAPEIIINLSTAIGVGVSVEDRLAPVIEFKPEMASLNTNSMNFATGDWSTGRVLQEIIFENQFQNIVKYAKKMREFQVRPEIEVYDFGGFYNIMFLQKNGYLMEPLHFQFVFGVLGGVPFTPMNFAHLLDLKPKDATWSVCGVAKNQFQAAVAAILQGGHIRVGLEDNIKNIKGELAAGSNEQVAWTKQLVELCGLEVATPDEAREILRIRGSKSWEALQKAAEKPAEKPAEAASPAAPVKVAAKKKAAKKRAKKAPK